MKLNPLNWVGYPIRFRISTFRDSQTSVSMWWKMLNFLFGWGIIAVIVAICFFTRWYQRHPVLGKVALGILAVWGIWLVIRWFRSFNDDPLLRKEPYRRIELDEENIKFNPMNEQNPQSNRKDETPL